MAILFTVLAASVPAVVGVLVEPKAETMSFIPAVLYSDLIFCLVALSSCCQPRAWSAAPVESKNESALDELVISKLLYVGVQ